MLHSIRARKLSLKLYTKIKNYLIPERILSWLYVTVGQKLPTFRTVVNLLLGKRATRNYIFHVVYRITRLRGPPLDTPILTRAIPPIYNFTLHANASTERRINQRRLLCRCSLRSDQFQGTTPPFFFFSIKIPHDAPGSKSVEPRYTLQSIRVASHVPVPVLYIFFLLFIFFYSAACSSTMERAHREEVPSRPTMRAQHVFRFHFNVDRDRRETGELPREFNERWRDENRWNISAAGCFSTNQRVSTSLDTICPFFATSSRGGDSSTPIIRVLAKAGETFGFFKLFELFPPFKGGHTILTSQKIEYFFSVIFLKFKVCRMLRQKDISKFKYLAKLSAINEFFLFFSKRRRKRSFSLFRGN